MGPHEIKIGENISPIVFYSSSQGEESLEGEKPSDRASSLRTTIIMKYVGLLSGGKDSCFNLLHCKRNGHELVAAASLGPPDGKGSARFTALTYLDLEA